MTKIREVNIISIVNNNESPDTIGGFQDEEEKEFYEEMLQEKADFKAETGRDLQFEMPMESYNDLW